MTCHDDPDGEYRYCSTRYILFLVLLSFPLFLPNLLCIILKKPEFAFSHGVRILFHSTEKTRKISFYFFAVRWKAVLNWI
jgi:hypothetical protein